MALNFETYKQNRLAGKSPREAFIQSGGTTNFSAGRTLANIPASTGRFLGGVAGAIAHPIRTIKTIGSLVAGASEKLIPGEQAEEKTFDSLVNFYKDRYGSFDKFLSSVENDPVGVLADASTLLTAGGAIASKLGAISRVGGVSRAGTIASATGQAINPLRAVGAVSGLAKSTFPKIARALEKSSLRLTKTKEGALATRGLDITDDAINITKNRLNEVSSFLAKQKIIGNPIERFAKATQLYNKAETVLDGFFDSLSKGSVADKTRVIRALNGLKSAFKGHRDIEAISKQIDGAIRSVEKAAGVGGKIGKTLNYKILNKIKRTTYENAYNKAGEKVVDGVEHAIGDVIRGIQIEDLRGLKIAGQSVEKFMENYGLLIEGRKLLKLAVGKPELSVVTERLMMGGLGYLIGGGSALGGGAGAFLGAGLGPQAFGVLPVTKLRSLIGAGAQKASEIKLPEVVRQAKAPLTAIERIRESQNEL